MPSETFYCPQCRRQLTKSAQAYVLGELMDDRMSGFIALGSLSEIITCPGCGTAIDTRKMLAGDFDTLGGGASGCLVPLVALAAFGVAVFIFDHPWWVGLLCGSVAGGTTHLARTRLRARRST